MARPTKLTPEVQKKIVEAIGLGSTYKLSAQYGGISYDTFNDWMKRGEQAKSGKFLQFFEAVKAAEGRAAVGWLAKIEIAANDGNWTAAAWKLERRYPKDYGRQVKEIAGSLDIRKLSDEELLAIIED
jgi:transposase